MSAVHGTAEHALAQGAEDADALLRLIRESQAAGISRNVLLVRLSPLPSSMTRPHHVRLVWSAVEPLLRADRARLFRLSDERVADLAVVWRGGAEQALAHCLLVLERLFTDSGWSGTSPVAEAMLLPGEADRLLAAIASASAPPAADPEPDDPQGLALDTVALATLEARLARADMSRFARRRDVCALDPRGRFAPQWERRYFSLTEIGETLIPDRSLRADPWLFRRLTRTFDARMLALLSARGELDDAGPFSISLNVASILSPAFLHFDANLPNPLRGAILLELHPADMLADPSAFLFARDFARARHYRLGLHGVSADLLEVLPLSSSGLDLLLLRWSAALGRVERLASDPSLIVLDGVSTDEAIGWGRARGIALFCGRLALRGARAPLSASAWQNPAGLRGLALGEAAAPT